MVRPKTAIVEMNLNDGKPAPLQGTVETAQTTWRE